MIVTSLSVLCLLAVAAPSMHRLAPRATGLLLPVVVAGLGAWFAALLAPVAAGETPGVSWPWVPDLGIALSFRLDGLSLAFALLICVIGAIVLLHASASMRDDARLGVFYARLIGFMAAMLGLVTADNLLLLFVFWELTSVASFLLIGFDHGRADARRSALQALLVTGLGGLVLLAGLIILGLVAGTFELSELVAADVRDHALYAPMVVLILIGCFTKSAMLPVHFWLPNAMAAPTPVSALLHSSTMVKAGVYLVARLHPSLGGTLLWDDALILVGGTTMLVAAWLAARQRALKLVLAYSTVSSLGALMMLIGMGAAKAAGAYLLAHAMFKACLFLAVGTVTDHTGEKDPERLGGLLRTMPLLGVAALLGSLSMAGMFPLAGFVGKELLLKAGLAHPEWAGAATVVTVLAAIMTVAAAGLVGVRVFLGRSPVSVPATRPDVREVLGPLVLAVLGVVAGIAPALFAAPLVEGIMASMTGTATVAPAKLHVADLLWPPSAATALSVIALSIGAVVYLGRGRLRDATRGPAWMSRLGDRAYDACTTGLLGLATATTGMQSGRLRSYVRWTLLAATIAMGASLLRVVGGAVVTATPAVLDVVIAAALVACAVAILRLRSALAAIAVLGGIGFLVALFFVLYGAPDVAMTQIAIETLIVIIFVLVLRHLPPLRRLSSRRQRLGDALVAGAFGIVMAGLAAVAAVREVPAPVSDAHAALSVPEGYGRNVVNVILVDFRALDTLGEIFVLGIAAVGVYSLLRLRPRTEAPA